jgi:DNA-binding response OmpR family regulator
MAEVMLVRWPEDGEEGERLAGVGVAVLYLVNDEDEPPTPTSCLEDWIRIPGDDRDLRARVAALELRAASHHSSPRIDDEGRLHYHGKVLALSPEEAEVARLLTERFGDLVSDDELEERVNDAELQLRARMTHLRANVRGLGLALRRIRRRGYILQRR